MQRKQNKDFIQQLLFCVSRRAFTRVPRHMRVMLLMQEPAFGRRTCMCCAQENTCMHHGPVVKETCKWGY